MKIIRLEAENVKRLKAVTINPDGTLQVVTGRNAQGKSSVLDAIWLALGGGAAARNTPRPVRDGEKTAHVTLNLGDLTVTRTWDTRGKTSLKVTAPDGAAYKSPQTLLDQLVGKLSFDPLEFTRLSAREQRAALLDLLDLDFTDADKERERLYSLRLETGRRAHGYGDLPKLEEGAPLLEESASSLVAQIGAAQEANRLRDKYFLEEERLTRAVMDASKALREAQERLDAARKAERVHAELGAPPAVDFAPLREKLNAIEAHNAEARANQKLQADRAAQAELREQYTEFTHQIEAIDQKKADALAAAKMPVDGLGFDDQGVTYQGLPFAQASSAEQIRVSLAMAMALNPTLRVVRIMDGSLLDADSMQALAEQAAANDMQIWVERVGDESAESAVVIEDGQVVQP